MLKRLFNIVLPIFLFNFAIYLKGLSCQDGSNLENFEIHTESTAYTIKVVLNDTTGEYRLENVTCINGKNSEIIANEHHVCESLDPCTSYKVFTIIRFTNESSQQIFEKTVEAQTNYSRPSVEFKDVVKSVDYINISWTAVDETCISKYIIEVISIDKVLHYELTDKRETQVTDVKPCLDYNITLEVIDIGGDKFPQLSTSATTDYAEPGDVVVTFLDGGDGDQKVTWEIPTFKTCVSVYHLKWFILDCIHGEFTSFVSYMIPNVKDKKCEGNVSISDPNLVEYTIKDLQGCEHYGFNIYINQNSTPKAKSEFLSAEQVPTAIRNQDFKIDETEVTIFWDPPENHTKCVKSYIVTIAGPLQDKLVKNNKSTSETRVTFDNLYPCGEYNISVAIETISNTHGPDFNNSFTTKEGTPTAVQNLTIIPDSHKLLVSWNAPAFAHLCVVEYHVTGWTDESSQNFGTETNKTTVTISALSSCQPYTVQIIPTTISKKNGELKQIETSTLAVEAKPPKTFQVVGLYPNRLELSAHELDVDNNCETISAKFYCSTDAEDLSITYKSAEQYVNEGQLGGISFQALLSPLSPFVSYKCQVSLFNIAGWSTNSTLLQKTEPYFPDRPDGIKLQSSTSSSLSFIWDFPNRTNGIINLYKCYFQMYEPNYFVPPSCVIEKTKPDPRETSELRQLFSNLQPFTKYSFQVAAQNQYGIGEYTRPFIVTTKSSVSEKVTNLKANSDGPYLSDTEYKASVLISFLAPCKSNGNIEYIRLQFNGDRINCKPEQFYRWIKPEFDESGHMKYNETQLKPEYNYTVYVEVKTEGVDQWGPSVKATFDSPAGIPLIPSEDVLNKTKVSAFESDNPTRTAVVRFSRSILESQSGNIIYMALLVSQKECTSEPQLRYGALNSILEWPDTPSWIDVHKSSSNKCTHQYQTTPNHWIPDYNSNIKSIRGLHAPLKDEILYIIGTEDCNDAKDKYCNGPLEPETEYYLVFRLFTKSGYRDSYMVVFKTDSLIQVSLILFSVCGCLLIAFVTGIIYLWVTKRIQLKRQSYHDIVDSFGDITSKNFATYYHDIVKPEKIAREFKELSGVAMDLSISASEMGCTKNRYVDIFPYDKNRVILDIDAEGSDYINASFIDGYNRKKEYIATQGPKLESTLDFWRMILKYNVRVIVMVTQFKEDNIPKCHTYFPFNSKGIVVNIKKVDSVELYDRTEMSITHEKYGLKQKITHYFFKKWPDRSVPMDPNHLINFVKKVKSERTPRYSPIVVHCSAGVGRTGTFIALDIIMQRLKNESKINIYETVKKLRFQRMKMVQTFSQYSFLYICTYELVKHKKLKQNYVNKNKKGKSVCFQDMEDLKVEIPVKSKIAVADDTVSAGEEYEMHNKIHFT